MQLRYVGYPFVDVGVATIFAYAMRIDPDVKTLEDIQDWHIQRLIEEICKVYIHVSVSNFLGTVVFANVGFANPRANGNTNQTEIRRRRLKALLMLYKNPEEIPADISKIVTKTADKELCVLTGEKALVRVSRTIMPLIGNEEDINFYPQGKPKLPIAGWCVLALLAMPFGGLISEGKLLIVHSTNHRLMEEFAREHIETNMKHLSLGSNEKVPNYKFPETHIVQKLRQTQARLSRNDNLIAYHFSSSGQDADIRIMNLPSNVIGFVQSAYRLYPTAWINIESNAWYLGAGEKIKKADKERTQREIYKQNYLYEDLFRLPVNARSFLRRYLLRFPRIDRKVTKADRKLDPRFTYSSIRQKEMISWGITELFVERIMHMDKKRVEAIKSLGDRIARYIGHHDARLLKRLYFARNDQEFRRTLIRADFDDLGKGNEPIMLYDEFVYAFFEDEGEVARYDYNFARDLLLIRIIEQLHKEWTDEHEDVLQEISAELEKQDEESEEN